VLYHVAQIGHIKDIGHDPSLPTTRLYATHEAQPYHNDSSDIVGAFLTSRIEMRPATVCARYGSFSSFMSGSLDNRTQSSLVSPGPAVTPGTWVLTCMPASVRRAAVPGASEGGRPERLELFGHRAQRDREARARAGTGTGAARRLVSLIAVMTLFPANILTFDNERQCPFQ